MQYKVDWCEGVISSKGTKYKRATVIDEHEVKTEGVAVFETFSKYGEVEPGRTVEGVVRTKDYKGKPSHSLEDGNLGPKPAGLRNTRTITEAMEKKEASIERFQGHKEQSIQLASAQRDAVLIVSTLMKGDSSFTEDIVKMKIVEWRNWFLSKAFTDSTIPF